MKFKTFYKVWVLGALLALLALPASAADMGGFIGTNAFTIIAATWAVASEVIGSNPRVKQNTVVGLMWGVLSGAFTGALRATVTSRDPATIGKAALDGALAPMAQIEGKF